MFNRTIPWRCLPKSTALFGLVRSKYYKTLECIKNLDDMSNFQNIDFFKNEISEQIVNGNLITEILHTEPSTLTAFADILLARIEYFLPISKKEVIQTIIDSKELNNILEFGPSLNLILLKIKFRTIRSYDELTPIINESLQYITQPELYIIVDFCKSLFKTLQFLIKPDDIIKNDIRYPSLHQLPFVQAFNTLISTLIQSKPNVFAEQDINLALQNILSTFNLLAPPPLYFIKHPLKCSFTSALTISIILGEIIAAIDTDDDLESTVVYLHSFAPVQTRDCLWYYTNYHTKIYLDLFENSKRLIDIVTEDVFSDDLFTFPYYIECIREDARIFFEKPNANIMEQLLEQRIEYERVISFANCNFGQIFFSEILITDILNEELLKTHEFLKNLNLMQFIHHFEVSALCIQAMFKQFGISPKLIFAISRLVHLYFISPLYTHNSITMTFIQVQALRILKSIKLIIQHDPKSFIDFAFKNNRLPFSVYCISKLHENIVFPTMSINFVQLFMQSLRNQSNLMLHLSSKMLSNVLSGNKDDNVAFVIIECILDVFLLNSDDLAAGCYLLRVLSKITRIETIHNIFIANEGFVSFLNNILQSNMKEYNYLAQKIKINIDSK